MRKHCRPERGRISADRLFGAAFEPGEQFDIGRPLPVPDQLHLLRILAGKRGDGGLGQPRRHANAQCARDQLEQRPAAGFIERIEPAGELSRQRRLAKGREPDDNLA